MAIIVPQKHFFRAIASIVCTVGKKYVILQAISIIVKRRSENVIIVL